MRPITLFSILSSSAFALALATTTAHADEQPHEDRGPQWGLGLGVSSETSPYQGVDT